MTTPRPDPLTPEERALADRLARLGPHDGPSPALDARILAAAHRAVAGPAPARRHWRTWLATPASLVTAVGTAATLALAIGVVWQLRPPVDAPVADAASVAEGSADGPAVTFESVPAPRPMVMPAPPAASAPVPASTTAATAAQAARDARRRGQAERAAAAARSKQEASARRAPAAAEQAETGSRATAAAEVDAVEAFPEAGAASDATAAAAPPPAAPPVAGRPSYTNTARARAELPARDAAKAAAPAATAQAASTAESAASTVLDRIEVSGTRVSAPSPLPPLHEDAGLAPVDWLERIRARRDAGDVDDARASLAQFRRAHPRVRVPDDLAALLQ